MVEPGAGRFESLAAIGSVFVQVNDRQAEQHDGHATREPSIALEGRDDEQRSQLVTVERDAPVEVRHRQADMVDTRRLWAGNSVNHVAQIALIEDWMHALRLVRSVGALAGWVSRLPCCFRVGL